MAQHLTEEDYTEIKRMRAAGFALGVIGRKFGRRYSTISNICNGKTLPKEAKTDRLNKRNRRTTARNKSLQRTN